VSKAVTYFCSVYRSARKKVILGKRKTDGYPHLRISQLIRAFGGSLPREFEQASVVGAGSLHTQLCAVHLVVVVGTLPAQVGLRRLSSLPRRLNPVG
jgi:hypothetical protein